ncbi:MAG TPA: phosphatase PAP2 family protein [Terriglobales bacterium]|nr:phosphatase PAP2 family protein [Terriglobales bacterium]
MSRMSRLQQQLAIVWSLSMLAVAVQGQALPKPAAPPDLVPSTAISDGAPSFHLTGGSNGLLDSDQAVDSARTEEGNHEEGFVTGALKRGVQDQKEIWSAPFHRKNLKWDALFLAGTGILVAVDEQVLHALPDTQVSTSSTVSNAIIVSEGAALGGIFFIGGLHGRDTHAKETGYIGMEALANSFLVYLPLQLIAGRERPNEGTGEGTFFKNHSLNTSFPGGHSMFAFTMATVVAHEYPRWWVQLLSYGAASALTGARMSAKMHFPSDLLVGGALGYLIGTHVFHSRCNPDLGGDCHTSDKEGP